MTDLQLEIFMYILVATPLISILGLILALVMQRKTTEEVVRSIIENLDQLQSGPGMDYLEKRYDKSPGEIQLIVRGGRDVLNLIRNLDIPVIDPAVEKVYEVVLDITNGDDEPETVVTGGELIKGVLDETEEVD